MDALCDAVNAYAKLPVQHHADIGDFVQAIHRCQDLLAVRIVRRVYPTGWTNVLAPRGPNPLERRHAALDAAAARQRHDAWIRALHRW